MQNVVVREQIINFLLQQLDANEVVMQEQQKKIAELEKAVAPKSE